MTKVNAPVVTHLVTDLVHLLIHFPYYPRIVMCSLSVVLYHILYLYSADTFTCIIPNNSPWERQPHTHFTDEETGSHDWHRSLIFNPEIETEILICRRMCGNHSVRDGVQNLFPRPLVC